MTNWIMNDLIMTDLSIIDWLMNDCLLTDWIITVFGRGVKFA